MLCTLKRVFKMKLINIFLDKHNIIYKEVLSILVYEINWRRMINIRYSITECYFYSNRLYDRFEQYFMMFLQIFETLLRNPSSTEQRVFYTIFAIGQTISSVYPLNLNAGFHVKIYMWSNG